MSKWVKTECMLPRDRQQVLFVTPKCGDLGPSIELGCFEKEVDEFNPNDEELKCKPAFVISEWDHDINYYVDEIEWWMPAPELPEGINGRSE